MRTSLMCGVLAAAMLATGCDIVKFTANSTSKVMARAQPSLQMESDYELAARAIPGALKTIEGFWVVSPDNPNFLAILTEGYCQYGSGFVEDEVEQAEIRKDFEAIDYHRARATKMYLRCMNYALKRLGKRWQNELFGTQEQVEALLKTAGKGQRNALMWAAVGLASAINMNKDRPEMTSNIDVAKAMLARVIEIDEKSGRPGNKVHAALPYIALGMANTGLAKSLGGDPVLAATYFEKAIEISEGKLLLASVLYAKRVGFRNNDRKFYHDGLMKVLQTPPSIWPEQRLANEIAHRRARRYLSQEKEIFE